MPPPEFDPMVVGVLNPYTVTEVSSARIEELCGLPGYQTFACTSVQSSPMQIYIDEALYGEARAKVMRHELGHINGWKH
jgi:hypothetical protein